MGIYDVPRRLIEAITGRPPAELFHNRKKAECCGAGSVMYATNPDAARKVALLRLGQARQSQTDLLVTACQNCKTVLEQVVDKQLTVMDLSEFVALHLEGNLS